MEQTKIMPCEYWLKYTQTDFPPIPLRGGKSKSQNHLHSCESLMVAMAEAMKISKIETNTHTAVEIWKPDEDGKMKAERVMHFLHGKIVSVHIYKKTSSRRIF